MEPSATEAKSLLELVIDKATNLAEHVCSGSSYQATESTNTFPAKLAVLKSGKDDWESLLNKCGLEAHRAIQSALEEACQQLDREEVQFRQLQSKCCDKKLLFPTSVVKNFDAMLKAFESLSKERLQNVTRRRVPALLFEEDPTYVPFERTITAVRQALESKSTGQVVTLHGGPGQGKTSMAKYVASDYQARYRDARPASVTEPAGKSIQFNGVLVLNCGKNANSTELLVKLWQAWGYQSLPAAAADSQIDKPSPSNPNLQCSKLESTIRERLMKRVSKENVLIVLDNVWESRLIEKLLMPRKWIKYLITTQIPEIWGDSDCQRIQLMDPRVEDAYKILENHVPGFLATDMDRQTKDAIEMIIEKSHSNPLILANVATKIRTGNASDPAEWIYACDYLKEHHHLQSDANAELSAIMCGHSYSKPMQLSTAMAFESFTNEEQTLLFLASIFESQPVPEVVFKSFFKMMHPSPVSTFERCSENLGNTDFIKIESTKILPWSSIPRRSWSLHTGRQHCIGLIQKQGSESVLAELLEQSKDDDIVPTLLVLYGNSSWRERAAAKLRIRVDQFQSDSFGSSSVHLTPIKAFVWLLEADGEEEWAKQSYQSAKQVLQTYLRAGDLDDYGVSKLLNLPNAVMATCEALQEWLLHPLSSQRLQNAVFVGSFPQTLEKLMGLLREETSDAVQNAATFLLLSISHAHGSATRVQSFPGTIERLVELLRDGVCNSIKQQAVLALGAVSKEAVANARKVASCPDAIEILVGLLGEGGRPDLQLNAAFILGMISKPLAEIAKQVGSYPGAIERLVGLLQQEVSPGVQKAAAWTLGQLSKGVVRNARRVGACPGAIERLVSLIGSGVRPDLQRVAALALGMISKQVVENAILVGSFPRAIKRLVKLLKHKVSLGVQEAACWTLARISERVVPNARKVGSCHGAIERLVDLLKDGGKFSAQENAAWALGIISEQVVENAVLVGSFPNAIERLVGLLQHRVSPHVQEKSKWKPGHIYKVVEENARKVGSYPSAYEEAMHGREKAATWTLAQISLRVVENARKVASCLAIKRLVGLLRDGVMPDVQKNATWVLGIISKHLVENAKKVGSFPGAIEGLVELLRDGVLPDVQKNATWVLGILSQQLVENGRKVGSFPHAIERLVQLLTDGKRPDVQESAAWVLGTISEELVENARKVGSYPDAIERLVGLLQPGVSPHVQEIAAWTLGVISQEVVENARKVGSYPNAIGRLVTLLQQERTTYVQEVAALTLGAICQGVVDNARKVGSHPYAIEILVELLQQEGSPGLQESATWILGALSDGVVENAKKVGSYPSAIERLVGFLQQEGSPWVQEGAAWTLGIISEGVVENVRMVGSYPGAIERLVGLLQLTGSPGVQEAATWTLGHLSQGVVENARKVGSCPSAIERLVGLLQQEGSLGLQEAAAWTLGQVSQQVVENARKIGSCPGAMEKLVGLLGDGVRLDIQKNAAYALGVIIKHVMENASKGGSRHCVMKRLLRLLTMSPDLPQNLSKCHIGLLCIHGFYLDKLSKMFRTCTGCD
ncbi:unnamed protein product [Calypogeia fissa]